MEEKKIRFGHEKLEVYQRSLKFIAWLDEIILSAERNRNIIDQIDKASISVSLNIAEGNGKSSKKDQNRFLEISRGSSLECAACLDVMFAKRMISSGKADEGKEQLEVIVKMLFKLSQSILGSITEKPTHSPNLSHSLSHH
ncbi:MAG TPA: four helix bundle protein [Bacteroidia bacterium]|nr:four helix bundle protein [Bacteroidia bacterium]